MKTHAIIPIFIPHQGCPNDCVFCNQRAITARQPDVTGDEVRKTIETWLTTLTGRRGMKTVEIAFFGGSFTGLPIKRQSAYLKIASAYKQRGLVQKLHLSTRPDYINEEILDLLKFWGVDVIELGVQSFDDRVLAAAGRGHDSAAVYRAAEQIQSRGFELGIQLMIGLPEDNLDSCLYSARETAKIGPTAARLYPTIVIEDTHLMRLYRQGLYTPLSLEEAVETTKEMYKILMAAGINILRVGLKSSDLIQENGKIEGTTFHPAFRQLVESRIAREKMCQLLMETRSRRELSKDVTFFSNDRWFSNLIGHKRRNKVYFASAFPGLRFHYKTRPLEDGRIGISVADSPSLMVK